MSHAAPRTILPVAGWKIERAVEITGVGDPILPTPFRIGETSAAALGATDRAARVPCAGVAGAGHVAAGYPRMNESRSA